MPGTPLAPPAGPAYVGLAEGAYQRNDLDKALRQVTEGIALCRQFLYPAPLTTGLVTLAWIRQAQGDPGGAREAMDEAGRAAPGPGVTGLLNPVPTQRARLVLAQGDVATAARWTRERGLDADDEPSYPQEPEHLVLARVLLAQDRPGPALGLLERLHAAAAAQGRAGSIIEIQPLRALGFVVDLGGAAAAANPLGVPLSGLPAKAVTRGYHLGAIPANRVRIACEWLLNAVLPRQAVQFGLVPAAAVPLGAVNPDPRSQHQPTADAPPEQPAGAHGLGGTSVPAGVAEDSTAWAPSDDGRRGPAR